MKKITMQDIADELNISRVTVWKVFNDYPGVSKSLRDLIIEKSEEMGYNKTSKITQTTDRKPSKTVTISVVVSRPESSLFWMNIIHHIAKTVNDMSVNMLYTYVPNEMPDDYELPDVLVNGSVSGIVILNVYDTKMLSLLNNLSIPKVFLDMTCDFPLDSLTGDLFLLEGETRVQQMTQFIIDHGRKRIGFIGDINYAITNRDRYRGFQKAMALNQLSINSAYIHTEPIGIFSYQEEIHRFLSSLDEMPEAFVCVSDYVANFLLDYLKKNEYAIPHDVAVSGYDGSREYSNLSGNLTTVPVDVAQLGLRLAHQLLYRLDHPDMPGEVTYIYTPVRFNETTNF